MRELEKCKEPWCRSAWLGYVWRKADDVIVVTCTACGASYTKRPMLPALVLAWVGSKQS